MSRQNGFNAQFGVVFEDYSSVKKKLDLLTNKINSETSKGIKLNIDSKEITNIVKDLSKLARQDIQILPDGQITTISKFNAELGKTITLKNNLSKNEVTIGISKDEEQRLRDYTKLFDQVIKQEEAFKKTRDTEYKTLFDQAIKQEQELAKAKQQSLNSEWKEMETVYKQEQNFINASQKLKQKNHQEALKQAQEEAKIHNKLLEEQYKETRSEKEQLENAKKLISYEKERLQVKLQSIQANRKDLVNENYSKKIGEGISNLNGNTVAEVKEKVRQLNLELQKLDQSAKMNGLQVGNKNIMSLGESLKSTATKLGIFASTAMVLNGVQQTIKNSISYVKELDDAMIDLKKVTDESAITYQNFLKNIHDASLELGTQSNKMVEATTNWAKTGETLENASKLAESTILLTKVGDIEDVNTAQSYMVGILKSFNIEAENAITLVDKYNNLSNNMATETRDLGAGMNIASNSLAVAGNTLEQSLALMAAGASTTQQSGETIGNALKTISLRVAQFKDEDGELIPSLEESFKRLGVATVDSAGQIRSTFDILRDLGEIYKDLDRNSQLALSEEIGGKHQANIVASILSQVEELNKAYELASNSAGSALQEFETYKEGIQYSLDRLQEQINKVYTNLINSDIFKGLIDGATSVIGALNSVTNVLGTFPTVITGSVGAMTIFSSKFRESTQMMYGFVPAINNVFNKFDGFSDKFSGQIETYRKQISSLKALTVEYQKAGLSTQSFGTNLATLNTKLALTTAKLIATKVATIALQSVLSMGLSLAISGVTSLVGKMITSMDSSSKSMDSCKQQAESLANALDSVSKERELTKQYAEIKTQLEDANLEESKRNELKKELDGVMQNLLTSEQDYYGILNNENLTLDDQLEKMEQIRQARLFDEAKALDKEMMSQKEIEAKAKMLKEYIQTYQDIEQALNSGNKQKLIDLIGASSTSEAIQMLKDTKNKINELDGEITKYNSRMKLINDSTFETSRSIVNLDSDTNKFITTLNTATQAINDNTKAKEENSNIKDDSEERARKLEELANAYTTLGYSAKDVKDKMKELRSLSSEDLDKQLVAVSTEAYNESKNKVQELKEALKDLNKEQAVSSKLISEIAGKYPDILKLGSSIYDLTSVQEFLNQQIENQAQIQASVYENMISYDTDYYNNKIKNNEEFMKAINDSVNSFVGMQNSGYEIDFNNYSNLNELKNGVLNQFGNLTGNSINEILAMYAKAYTFDSNNFADLQSMKQGYINQLLPAIANWIASN